MNQMKRRRFLAATAAGAALAYPPLRTSSAQPQPIVVTSYGGIWERAVRDIFVANFRARTFVPVEIRLGGPRQWMAEIEANLSDPPIDVLVNTIDLALIAGKRGLVERVDPSSLAYLADIPQRFIDVVEGWGVVFDYGSAGIAYHADHLPNPPRSIQAMIDGALAGDYVVSLPGIAYDPTPQILIWSLADALGGSVANVDPAFEALNALVDNNAVIFYGGTTDFLDHLEHGDAHIGIHWDGRTWAHHSAGADWIRHLHPEEGSVISPVVVQKVVHSSDYAWDYIDTMLAPGPQLAFAEMLQYGVTNSRVDYPAWLQERIVPWEQTRWPPYEAIAERAPEWIERWQREIGP